MCIRDFRSDTCEPRVWLDNNSLSWFSFRAAQQTPQGIATQKASASMRKTPIGTKIGIREVLDTVKLAKRRMSDFSDAEGPRPRLWAVADPFHPDHSCSRCSANSTEQSDFDDGIFEGPGDDFRALEKEEAEMKRLIAMRRYWKSQVLHLFLLRTSFPYIFTNRSLF